MRKFFLGVLLIIFLFVLAKVISDTFFIKMEHIEIPLPALPPVFDGLRILQLSDLHGRRLPGDGKLAQEIKAANPDLIVLTGDYVKRKAEEIDNYYSLLEAMAAIAPVYAVSGNHDYWAGWELVAGKLQKAGITVLDNRHVKIQKEGQELILAGVSDPHTGHDHLPSALPPVIDAPVILLAHAPTWFVRRQENDSLTVLRAEDALWENVALILTGHTHGGQIKLPFVGPVTTASGRLFPRDYIEGLSREGNIWLYISRGIGQSGIIPLRFLSPAEMTLITLRTTAPK